MHVGERTCSGEQRRQGGVDSIIRGTSHALDLPQDHAKPGVVMGCRSKPGSLMTVPWVGLQLCCPVGPGDNAFVHPGGGTGAEKEK